MLGFHRRTRSLIPVKDLAKYDLVSIEEEDEEQYDGGEVADFCSASEATNKSRSRQLMLVYLVFFAEAQVLPFSYSPCCLHT